MAAEQPLETSAFDDERERLRRKLERTQLLIEVSSVVVSQLSLKGLLVTISNLLKRFVNHEFASVVLYNEELQELRVHALDVPSPADVLSEGSVLPMLGTPP